MMSQGGPMTLTQLNFRVPRWQHRKLWAFAKDDGLTLEGFLQDMVQRTLDERLDELEEETRVVSDYIGHRRTQLKFTPQVEEGQP